MLATKFSGIKAWASEADYLAQIVTSLLACCLILGKSLKLYAFVPSSMKWGYS